MAAPMISFAMSLLMVSVIIAGADAFVPAFAPLSPSTPPTNYHASKLPRVGAIRLTGRSSDSREPDASTVVSELLEIVSPGLEGEYSAEQRQRIDTLLDQLDEAGRGGLFLQNEAINDYYRVQFTRDVGRGKPVGGGLRYTALGRALFKVHILTHIRTQSSKLLLACCEASRHHFLWSVGVSDESVFNRSARSLSVL